MEAVSSLEAAISAAIAIADAAWLRADSDTTAVLSEESAVLFGDLFTVTVTVSLSLPRFNRLSEFLDLIKMSLSSLIFLRGKTSLPTSTET